MPYMIIRGLGKIRVKKRPPKFSKTVKIGKKRFKADPHVQKVLWANKNIIEKERRRLSKKWDLPLRKR